MNSESQHTALHATADYIAALDALCSLARNHLCIFEKDFDNLGFNSEARYETLRAFLLSNPHNRLHLLAHDTRPLALNCPRILILLRQFSHSMHIYRTPPHLRHISAPFAVADASHYVRRFHFDDPRGVLARNDPEGARAYRSQFDEIWGESRPAVSATTLGL